MFEDLKKFIKRLQYSDEATKKRWLVGLSACTMGLIVSLWVGYISFTVENVTEPASNPGEQNAEAFWPVFKRGAVIIYDNFAQFFSEKVGEQRQITITNKKHTFQREGVQKIQPREIK